MTERVVCLGDSITEGLGDERGLGWVGRLSDYLAQTYPNAWHVNNLGVAGDTSIDINHRLFSEVLPRAPMRLIVAAGVNDTTQRLWPVAQGAKVDPTHARDIWRQIFAVVRPLAIPCLVLGLCPVAEERLPILYCPYDEHDHGHMAHNVQIAAYESMVQAEAKEAGIPFLPLFDAMTQAGYATHLPDGLHPNAAGYDLLFAAIKAEIQRLDFFRS